MWQTLSSSSVMDVYSVWNASNMCLPLLDTLGLTGAVEKC